MVHITKLSQIETLSQEEKASLQRVVEQFAFRSNSYYNSLIDWSDPDDPLRRIVMPNEAELVPWGTLDASDESRYMRAPGLEHKYSDTALLLLTDVCGAYCRFCFRKRLFMSGNDEAAQDMSRAVAYIREHSEVETVVLSGGDPLVLSTSRLQDIISQLMTIQHLKVIRIGTKMLAFNPGRTQDAALLRVIESVHAAKRHLYIMAHFNHARELTPPALEAVSHLQRAGATVMNQTPVIKGVNDKAEVLSQLFQRVPEAGVVPYYVFQCRPTLGNAA